MAITITQFGTGAQNQPLVFQGVTDNANCKRIRLELASGTTQVVLEQEPELGTNDTFRFEVSSLVRNQLNITMPSLTNEALFDLPVIFTEAVFSELDEDGEVLQPTLQSSVTLYPFNFFRGQSVDDFATDDNGSVNTRFLTNSPNLKKIKRGDLFYVISSRGSYSGSQNINAKQQIVIRYLDANGDTVQEFSGPYLPPQLPIYATLARVSPYGVSIKMPTNEAVKGVSVFVRDIESPNTVRSEIRVYNALEECTADMFTVHWLNQYSVHEISYFKGNVKRVNSVDRKTFVEAEPVNPAFFQGGLKNYENELTLQWELNTSRLKPKEIEYLAEILHSTNIVIEHKGEYVQVVCTNSNLNTFDKFNDIDFLTFQFTESKSTKFFV